MMYHLLTKTSVFMRLPNDCLCQLTGEPIVYSKPPPVPARADQLAVLSSNSTIPAKRNLPNLLEDTRNAKRVCTQQPFQRHLVHSSSKCEKRAQR
jgi:hypothetical protein